ncbi:MAG TPA: TonB-dependent receptor plug domain-containing protein [Longimicrobium sp.]|nr:TonB-dependent receptor plug domain-containing protein [Longimicrobium sp.]
MNARLPRFARLRAGALGMLGVAMLAGACDTPLPTAAEVEKMDVAAVESRTTAFELNADNTTYIVDGKVVTREEAHTLIGDRIATIEVTRAGGTGAAGGTIRITTGAARAEGNAAGTGTRTAFTIRGGSGHGPHTVTSGPFTGLVVIDGVVSTPQALHRLDPNAIHEIEVIKGAAATRQYDDPRAANGVIRVTTKAAQ